MDKWTYYDPHHLVAFLINMVCTPRQTGLGLKEGPKLFDGVHLPTYDMPLVITP